MKNPRIIYFLNDFAPTDEQRAEAEKLPVKVMWRNTRFIEPDDKPELCDAVMGEIPAQYKDFPGPEKILKEWAKEQKRRKELVGDVDATNVYAEPQIVGNPDDTAKQAADETKPVNPAIKPAKGAAWGANK